MDTAKTTIKLLSAAPFSWRDEVEELIRQQTAYTVNGIRMSLDGAAGRAVYLSEYLSQRNNGKNHCDANKSAKRKSIQVNKLLGYTYPEACAFDL
jgi:hypothetical protein